MPNQELLTHDLATLPDLNEEVILNYLKERFKHNSIYTYLGDILLAINPFKEIPIYNEEVHKQYCLSSRQASTPHVYALALSAYEDLKSNSFKSLCCVISGESGAGKTESTKHFLKHLMYLCVGNSRLELQILQVNPLLEAFGNAKTLMNDNSSRFGKYIELSFINNKVIGAKISEYLLEKSRVIFQNLGEQNFHIFYYLMTGLDHKKKTYYLVDEDNKEISFDYINNSWKQMNSYSEFKLKYDELINAMSYVAFTDDEQNYLFAALIGILHIGNLKFRSNDEGYSVFEKTPETEFHLEAISDLLGIKNTNGLIDALTTSLPTAGRDEFTRNYTLEVTYDARDAFAKHVYAKLFSWIVFKINETLSYHKSNDLVKEIGILDIYGFEHFQKNSFEQLCINLANEQIQYFFNKHIFCLEKEEYEKEGLSTISITFNDNQPLLDLFMSKNGILTKLDDLCKLPKTTDSSLIEHFNKEFSRNPYYIASKRSDLNFTISHYAGKVCYSGENFIEKNRDSLPYRVNELLRNSENEIINEIFIPSQFPHNSQLKLNTMSAKGYQDTMRYSDKSSNLTKISVSSQYRTSLEVLMNRMSESKPLFLRCIKPNAFKKANHFDDEFVLSQLRYCGVLETTRIRKEGFSLRPTFKEFIDKYKYLAPDKHVANNAITCEKILVNSNLKNWHVGKTRVFLKYYHYKELEIILDKYINSAIIIQKYAKRSLAIKKFNNKRDASKKQQMKAIEFSSQIHLKYLGFYDILQETASMHLPQQDLNAKTKKAVEPSKVKQWKKFESENDQSCQKIYDNQQETPIRLPSVKRHEVVKPKTNGNVWLYGKITRGQSEELLKHKEIGSYLIRQSDSREGYSLSFKAENRCRHYMVDTLPNGKFIIIGEPKVHATLADLIDYHKKNKLSNWNGYLTIPCGEQAQ